MLSGKLLKVTTDEGLKMNVENMTSFVSFCIKIKKRIF